jgi:hypothetical protein
LGVIDENLSFLEWMSCLMNVCRKSIILWRYCGIPPCSMWYSKSLRTANTDIIFVVYRNMILRNSCGISIIMFFGTLWIKLRSLLKWKDFKYLSLNIYTFNQYIFKCCYVFYWSFGIIDSCSFKCWILKTI